VAKRPAHPMPSRRHWRRPCIGKILWRGEGDERGQVQYVAAQIPEAGGGHLAARDRAYRARHGNGPSRASSTSTRSAR
jgi:hypothetical protein